ncbi:unknown [Singapore grouper iridovirus]|uniref:Uncharacterized protein n=1 Tax=Singapore grouper iridovirus TaxID=262968 RepID=Q5YFQ6_9VIRU|nr:hypothetical protein ORF009L [Singapore grouper iridovirus]AAS18024.1 unknown [Singapore grouper iridovirus]WAU86718.1 hypothetical protein ORF009L [Singapore grouper iridovirus]
MSATCSVFNSTAKGGYVSLARIKGMKPILGGVESNGCNNVTTYEEQPHVTVNQNGGGSTKPTSHGSQEEYFNTHHEHYYGATNDPLVPTTPPKDHDDCMIHYPGAGWFSKMSTVEMVILALVVIIIIVIIMRMFGVGGGSNNGTGIGSGNYFMS